MKKRSIAFFGTVMVVAITVISTLFLVKKEYNVFLIMESEGTAVAGEELTHVLTSKNLNTDVPDILGTAFAASDTVYERGGKLYLGEEKVAVSTVYPFFVNSGSALFCVNNSAFAVTEDFGYVSTYQGLYISNGISFNSDMERAYREDFLFLQLQNGLFLNTMQMTVRKSDLPGEEIASASIVSFFETELRYYTLQENATFLFHRIQGLSADTRIKIDGTEYGYYDLLERLGLYEKEVLYEEITPTWVPTPTPMENEKATVVPTKAVPTSAPTPKATKEPEDTEEGGKATPVVNRPDKEKEDESITPAVKPTKTPTEHTKLTPTPKPTIAPVTPLPAQPADPADPTVTAGGTSAQPADPAAPEQPTLPEPVTPSKPGATIWKKPSVSLEGAFQPLVYSIKHGSLVVENATFLHKSGVTFEIFEQATGKLVTRKAYGGSASDVQLSGLRPETTYKVVVTMNYVDSHGGKQSEIIREGELVTTLSRSYLPKLRLNWSNGSKLYSNKAELVAIQQKQTQAAGDLYEDLISHIAKIGLEFKNGRNTQSFWLNQKGLTAFKKYEATDYTTPERLRSNTEYTYTFVLCDKYGECFELEGTYSGKISTAKMVPTAAIKVTKNEVQEIELSVSIVNEDAAWMGQTYFIVKDSNGSSVATALYQNDVYEEPMEYHLLAADNTKLKFTDLLDFEVYTIEVYTDYDIADLQGERQAQQIGSSKFVTASVTSLGLAYYEVGIEQIAADEATVSVRLNTERTNEKLAALLDAYDISFVKVERNAAGEVVSENSDGIVVTYVAKEAPETEEETASGEAAEGVLEQQEGESLGEGEEEIEAPGAMDIVFTAENGRVALAEYQLEALHHTKMLFHLSGLESISEYRMKLVPKVHMGTGKSETVREIRTSYTPDTLKTLKKTPYVKIDTAYVTGDKIRLFGVSVEDTDGAVVEYPLSIQVYNTLGQLIWKKTFSKEEVADGNKVLEAKIEGLERYQEYTLRFFVAKYNDSVEKENDYEVNYELYYEPYVKTKEMLVLTTGEAVFGDLNFEGLSRQKLLEEDMLRVAVGKKGESSLFTPYAMKRKKASSYSTKASDLSNIVYTWNAVSNSVDEAFAYYSHKDGANIWSSVYKATIDFGTGWYNAMSIGYMHNSGNATVFRLYVEDPVTTNAEPVATLEIGANKTPGNNKIKWLDTTMLDAGAGVLTGKQTVYLEEERLGTGTAWIGHFCGITFSHVEETKSEDTFFANLHVTLEDTKGQLGSSATYQIKVYKDGVLSDMQEHVFTSCNGVPAKTVRIYDVLHDTGEYRQYLETIDYEADDRNCEINFYYEVERYGAKGREYRFVLTTLVDGYEIVLDEVSFNSKTEVYPLRTRSDFIDMVWNLDASYVVVNDINMGTWYWEQTKLKDNNIFNGTLDFQGHTLTLNNRYSPIRVLGLGGVIENLVVRYAKSFCSLTTCALAYENYGTIRNVTFERGATNASISYYQIQGGIVYGNYTSGVIENFTINITKDWYVGQYVGGAAYLNYGMIRNGYLYGEAIRQVPEDYMDSVQLAYSTRIGGLVSINQVGGVVENCYTLIDLYASRAYKEGDGVCTLVGWNRGIICNSFSVGSVYFKEASGSYKIQSNVNPVYKNGTDVSVQSYRQVYLYSEENYGKASMQGLLVDRITLYDNTWYGLLFDTTASSKTGQFDVEPVRQEFYPHVNMSVGMPAQPWLSLPVAKTVEQPDILHTQVLWQEREYAVALISFYNPEKLPVQAIHFEYFDDTNVVILGQYEDEEFWRVQVKVSKPEKCYSEYAVSGFELGTAPGVIFYSKTYAKQEQKTVAFEFYNPVSSISDWIKINNDRSQNYRLYQDIDFALYPMEQVYIGNGKKILTDSATWTSNTTNFTGTLDGNGKTICNLDLRAYGGLFESVYGGTIKNLTVKNVDITAVNETEPVNIRRALIRNLGENAVVDNVHILGIKMVSTEKTGALVGYTHSGKTTIQNCSVHDAVIESTGINTGSTQQIGGLLGQASDIISIRNCYVDGLKLTAKDMASCGGVGGIAGFLYTGSELENLYVVDSVITSFFQYTGGVAGSITQRNYTHGYSLSNVYVDADISSLSDILGGFIGYAQNRNLTEQVNGLFLGNVTMKNGEFNYVSRYIGYKNFTTSLLTNSMYTMQETSYVNGRLNNADKDDSDVRRGDDVYTYLTREQLCNPEFYTCGINVNGTFQNLDIGDGFALTYEKEAENGGVETVSFAECGWLPWLLSADGSSVLPYQKYHSMKANDIQITGVKSASNPGNAELFDVTVTITHPEAYTVEEVTFDENVEVVAEPRFSVNGTETTVSYEVKARGYVDRYYIKGVKGSVNGTEKQVEVTLDSLIPAQFLDIRSVEDWNEKMRQYGMAGYNIRILADLDFSEKSDYEQNVNVNRVLGGNLSEADWVSIKNITRKTEEPLIANAYGSIRYLKVTDISMTKATSTEKRRNFAIIGNAIGNMDSVIFSNISLDASNKNGSGGKANNVAPIGILSGAASNIKLDGIYVHANGTGVISTNTTGGFIGQMTASASLSNVTAKNLIVNGQDRARTGGLVGLLSGATKVTKLSVSDFMVLGGNYVGTIAGVANDATYGRSVYSLTVTDGIISGNAHVGGIFGSGYVVNKDTNPSMVDGVLIMGSQNIGGAVGCGGASSNVTVKDSMIYGSLYVGGIVGYGNAMATHCVDSVIGSVYARSNGANTNDLYQKALKAKRAEYDKLAKNPAGLSENKLAYVKKVVTYFDEIFLVTRTPNTSKYYNPFNYNRYTAKPAANSKSQDAGFGGIAGISNLLESNVVINCTIGCDTAEDVGGIVGKTAYIGWNTWSRTLRIFCNGCQDSTVTGATNVGGVVGRHTRYTVSNCYSNATVSAKKHSVVINNAGTNAGGIIGILNKTGTYSLNESPRLYSVFFTGEVSADDYVAGIVGRCSEELYGDNRDFLVAGAVCLTSDRSTGHIQLIGNRLVNATGRFLESLVYEDALLIVGTEETTLTARMYYAGTSPDNATGLLPSVQKIQDDVTLVTSADLQNKDTYSKTTGKVQTGFTTTPSYWNFNGLGNGYLPYLTYYVYYGNNTSGRTVVRYQEGYESSTGGTKTYAWKKYEGGIPIPGYVEPMLLSLRAAEPVEMELPELTAYTVDADKLNLEFSAAKEGVSFTVEANGVVLATESVEKRVFTMNYDFKTTLLVTVTDGVKVCTYTIYPVDVSENVLVWDNEYYYITGNGIEGSRATIAGNFVSLAKGKALAADGSIYDVTTGNKIGTARSVGWCDEVLPLAKFTYESTQISLYHGFSVIGGVVREGIRLYVKDQTLYAVDSALTPSATGVLFGTLPTGEFTTILGNDRNIVDLTNVSVVLPEKFDNSGIAQMSNNLHTDCHRVLVRYLDGGVTGFDYLTGEMLPVVCNRVDKSSLSRLNGTNTEGGGLAAIAAQSYQQLQTFEKNLTASGWMEVDTGENSEGTANGSGMAEIFGSATENGSAQENGTSMENGTNTESGDIVSMKTDTKATITPEPTLFPTEGPVPEATKVPEEKTISGALLPTATGRPTVAGKKAEETKPEEKEALQAAPSYTEQTKKVYSSPEQKNARYIPYFDAEKMEYVLFDETELLTASEETLTSMNEKVALSGHMIDQHTPFVTKLEKMVDTNRNGLILLILTIVGVAVLLVVLIYKHENGGKANEED